MTLHWFTISALDPAAGQEALNQHLTTSRVAHVEKEFVADGANSYWSVCLSNVDGTAPLNRAADGHRRGSSKSIDYREVLAPDEFGLYDRLRTLRKGIAEAEGLPPYAVFTNEQLAAMVRNRASTAAALAAIDGIGEARVRRYAAGLLPLLAVPAVVAICA